MKNEKEKRRRIKPLKKGGGLMACRLWSQKEKTGDWGGLRLAVGS